VPPQPSPVWPHSIPWFAQVSGAQLGAPHLFAMPPPPHVSGATQVPQLRRLPQPSGMLPQSALRAAHVVAVQIPPPPHLLATPPPPQVWGATHWPQSSVCPPQPSLCLPHVPAG
jgi:hypothetical protein